MNAPRANHKYSRSNFLTGVTINKSDCRLTTYQLSKPCSFSSDFLSFVMLKSNPQSSYLSRKYKTWPKKSKDIGTKKYIIWNVMSFLSFFLLLFVRGFTFCWCSQQLLRYLREDKCSGENQDRSKPMVESERVSEIHDGNNQTHELAKSQNHGNGQCWEFRC